MKILVTGGAGFIGRWVVKLLLDDEKQVWVLDNFSNGRRENLAQFASHRRLEIIEDAVNNSELITKLFNQNKFDLCLHLAANINVQDSIDDPKKTFLDDIMATFTILEAARKAKTKVVFMSSCMIYDAAPEGRAIEEDSSVLPRSPYAASKIAGEQLVRSYFHAYGLPTVVLRPFNTYGPFQKTSAEGGVIAIFIHCLLNNQPARIYGDGRQTRDFLYVEDCARFVVTAGYSDKGNGEIINAATGRDININDLAQLIVKDKNKIVHVPHIHPQAEIYKMVCAPRKAEKLLGWKPQVFLEVKRRLQVVPDSPGGVELSLKQQQVQIE